MIPQSPHVEKKPGWQQALANAVSDPAELLAMLGLSGRLQAMDPDKIRQFPLRVPRSYVGKMRHGDVNDPLLRQVFPLIDEAMDAAGYVTDPVGDHLAVTSAGMLQKYHGRALLLTTGACAVHCRYCFRRHFPYGDSNPLASQWPQTLARLRADPSISEVILSGGDPLSLRDDKLAALVADLDAVPQLKRLRIHTRLPVVLPERIGDDLLAWIRHSRLDIVMVIHANHANELDETTAGVLASLRIAGCQLLNQAVLLRGVNDSVDAQVALNERLFEQGVLPYYLHLLDRVAGARHFEVTDEIGVGIVEQLRSRLPGYLVPKLVREQAGEGSKTPVG